MSTNRSKRIKTTRAVGNIKNVCAICKKVFSSKGNLIQHLETHTNVDAVEFSDGIGHDCEICGKSFSQRRYLLSHKKRCPSIRGYKTKTKRNHHCELCGKIFSRRSHLRRHKSHHFHHDSFACVTCDRRFVQQHHLERHFESLGHKRKELEARKTGRVGSGSNNINDEDGPVSSISPAASDDEEDAETDGEGSPKETIDQEMDELMRTTIESRRFKCPFCVKRFSTKWEMQRHWRSVHPYAIRKKVSDGRNHSRKSKTTFLLKCDDCNLRFDNDLLYQNHSEWHRGKRPYECDRCTRAFVRRLELDNHRAAKHGVGWLFECAQCRRRFSQRTAIDRHLERVHGRPKHSDSANEAFEEGARGSKPRVSDEANGSNEGRCVDQEGHLPEDSTADASAIQRQCSGDIMLGGRPESTSCQDSFYRCDPIMDDIDIGGLEQDDDAILGFPERAMNCQDAPSPIDFHQSPAIDFDDEEESIISNGRKQLMVDERKNPKAIVRCKYCEVVSDGITEHRQHTAERHFRKIFVEDTPAISIGEANDRRSSMTSAISTGSRMERARSTADRIGTATVSKRRNGSVKTSAGRMKAAISATSGNEAPVDRAKAARRTVNRLGSTAVQASRGMMLAARRKKKQSQADSDQATAVMVNPNRPTATPPTILGDDASSHPSSSAGLQLVDSDSDPAPTTIDETSTSTDQHHQQRSIELVITIASYSQPVHVLRLGPRLPDWLLRLQPSYRQLDVALDEGQPMQPGESLVLRLPTPRGWTGVGDKKAVRVDYCV